ncbi:hypothetical protein KI387_028106 [Taxus chinensis]|uniref:Uncharacterized protein n=1 Tax=Taxus chinensis TaxID=29808 RepID=A0AA38L4X7_TAXCH|nr:hypothetical protein KI387_028106 [Taxus chinensis]
MMLLNQDVNREKVEPTREQSGYLKKGKIERDLMESFESSDYPDVADGVEETYIIKKEQESKTSAENYNGDETGLIRKEFEHHEKGMSRLNNGSFGSCPASVLESQAKWAGLWLQQPDKFYYGPLQDGILQSRMTVAQIINAEHVDEVSLVDNVTTAVAIVLQQVAWEFAEKRFQKGDVVLMLHYAYGAVKKSIKAYAGRAGAHIIEAKLPFPVGSNEDIIGSFRGAVDISKKND